MPALFTPNEYVDMLLIYGECRKNSRQAAQLYRERFPDRMAPSHPTFANVERKMHTGSFPSPKGVEHSRPTRNEENVINTLAFMEVNPHASIRCAAEGIGIDKSLVQHILVKNGYHPYKIHLVQELRPNDPDRRLDFIVQIIIKIEDDPEFLNKIMWTDESRFHNNGVVNRHNCHYWSVENPHWMRETRFQTVWGVNVCCGIFNGRLFGSHFYQGTLNGRRYLRFLRNIVPELLEDIPLDQRQTMWWQQDGAPSHNRVSVTQHLNSRFHENWIGNMGLTRWPARSPDLSPLDFFLWGHLEEVVYAEKPNSLDDLQNKIVQACQQITPATITTACTREVLRRYELCQLENGGRFEHLI